MSPQNEGAHHRLFEAIAALKTPEECRLFFQDICTIKELQAMAQRLQVAARLDEGQNYNAVCEQTGASTATISRVNRALVYCAEGYKVALERMKQEEDK